MTNDVITQQKAGTIHLTEVPQRNVNTETTGGRWWREHIDYHTHVTLTRLQKQDMSCFPSDLHNICIVDHRHGVTHSIVTNESTEFAITQGCT